jgi:hypothetical protein
MGYSAARGKPILEKHLKLKISCQTLFNLHMSTISGFWGMAGFETRELVVTNFDTNIYYWATQPFLNYKFKKMATCSGMFQIYKTFLQLT